jgi:YfiR/HmsC-like
MLMAALVGAVPPALAQASEELVKATFVFRFTSFVTWPSSAFADPQAPIVLCVIGSDPFVRTLRGVIVGQRVNDRPFEVRRLEDATSAAQCHVLYVVGDRADDTLRAVRESPVLTITDGALGGSARGIMHFVIVDDRVRFHIDDASAAEGGLFMSSRLLSLAVSVRRRADP